MNMRRLPFVMLLTVSAWSAACSDPPPVDTPPQPTGSASVDAAPSAVPAVSATAAATTAATTAPVVETPIVAPKPAKEKLVGKWQFSFEGEPKAEEEGKKKFAKEKDTKKLDAYMKGIEDEAAGEWIEFADGTYISHVTEKTKDKVILKVKYDVTKDDNTSLTMKPNGKDEISKKELKDLEITVKFVDDNTISMVDPKKKMTLVFKRK
jgi:hypothetical protein